MNYRDIPKRLQKVADELRRIEPDYDNARSYREAVQDAIGSYGVVASGTATRDLQVLADFNFRNGRDNAKSELLRDVPHYGSEDAADYETRYIKGATLHFNGIPVTVNGQVTTHRANWSLINPNARPDDQKVYQAARATVTDGQTTIVKESVVIPVNLRTVVGSVQGNSDGHTWTITHLDDHKLTIPIRVSWIPMENHPRDGEYLAEAKGHSVYGASIIAACKQWRQTWPDSKEYLKDALAREREENSAILSHLKALGIEMHWRDDGSFAGLTKLSK